MPDFTPYAIVSKNIAEKKAIDTYGKNKQYNAEGDAYRHLVWSALMAKKYGPETTANISGYHESNMPFWLGGGGGLVPYLFPNQPANEKTMDTANNSLGLEIANKAKNEEEIYKLAKEYVDSGKAAKLKPLPEDY